MILQVLKDWARLERSQWYTKDKIAEDQARKLKAIVNHACEKVPFYQRLYKERAVDANSIASVASIARFPIVTKQDFRSAPLNERTALDTNPSLCTVSTTSGSTGTPITMLRTPRETAYLMAQQMRRLRAHGVGPRDRLCMSIPWLRGTSRFLKTRGLFGVLLRRKVMELPLAEDMNEHLTLFSKWKPTVIYAPVSYFRAFIEFLEETGKSLELRVVITGSEMLDKSTRRRIEDMFHAEVFETYGLVDAGAVAWECPTRSGYHINTDSLIAEFLREGEPVAAGEPGEICITSLYKKATPVIRYLVGDIATPLDSDCQCGRGLALMKNIEGRRVDFIITKNGHYVSPYTVMYSLENISGIEEFKVTQLKDYSVEVLVKPAETKADHVLKEVGEHCLQLFGETRFDIKAVERIENMKGQKRRPVQSLVNR